MSRFHKTRIQKPNPEENYKTYLARNGEPADAASNPLNLFDNLNVEDRAWFSLAQIYMTQKERKPA